MGPVKVCYITWADGGVTVCIIEKGQKPKKKTRPTVTDRGQALKVENTARGLQDNLQQTSVGVS